MRMIERWFPCAEVSEASVSGWGSGKSEKALFTWFAARPLAQAKAAVLTSLLPWPEDETDQRRLQDLVRTAMTGRDAAHAELVAELAKTYPDGASMLDPFSGRAMIPLEAARLGATAYGVDYSPVATLAGQLLADFPLRDWTGEPDLPFGTRDTMDASSRLVDDVRLVLREIGKRYTDKMADVYPKVGGTQPWGYVWAVTLPCQECGHRFPLTGSLILRQPLPAKGDPGQSFRIEVDRRTGEFRAIVHDGPPTGLPTLVSRTRDGKAVKGKSAVCPFCEHVHSKQTHQRLAQEGYGVDALLVAADLDEHVGKIFREPTPAERVVAERAARLLADEQTFGEFPAVPDEGIPVGNSDTVRASVYGAKTYGDLCNTRQTLGFVRLSRIIAELGTELTIKHGLSERYAAALTGYAASVLVRKIKRSTRGTALLPHKHATVEPRADQPHLHQRGEPRLLLRLLRDRTRRRPRNVALARRRHDRRASQSRIASHRAPGGPATRFCAVASVPRRIGVGRRNRPAVRQHDRLFGRVGSLLRVAQTRSLHHGPVVRVYVPRARRSGEGRRNHRQTVPGLEDSDGPPHSGPLRHVHRQGIHRSVPGCPS